MSVLIVRLNSSDIQQRICIESDGLSIQEIVMPTLAIQRRAANGEYDRSEKITQQRIVVTTAGFRGTYAHNVLIRTLLRQVTEPGTAIVLGGSYRIPIIAGLQSMDFIRQQKLNGSFNPTSFDREYMSRWSNGSDTAYFSAEIFDKYRSIQEPVFEKEDGLGKGVGYVFGVDIGRVSDNSEVAVWKVVPQTGTTSTKYLVNLYTFENMHFEEQAIEIKLLYKKFKPSRIVLDANGLGIGLVDELIKSQVDVRTGQFLPPFGVMNDEKAYYRQYRTADTIADVLYLIKANAVFNTEMYSNLQAQLTTGKLRFLVDERQARSKLEASRSKKFKDMTEDEKIDWIVPFTLTSILKDQMMNLEQSTEGANIILKRTNGRIKKDKVSAMGYGLWYIKTEIDDVALRQRTMSWDQMLKVTSSSVSHKQSLNTRLTFRGNRSYTSNLRRNK